MNERHGMNFVRYAKWYSIIPIAIIFAGLLVVLFFNFNLGLDFTGGRIIIISGFAENDISATREIASEEMKTAGINLGSTQFQQEDRTNGGGTVLSAKFPNPKGIDLNDDAAAKTFFNNLQASINAKLAAGGYQAIVIEQSDSLSASASSQRILNVFISVFAALLLILIYMLFRFKFNSGVSAVVGLFHDVLVMAALVAIFRIQINFVFVAAAITVAAYSLNNTLILFDRVRTKEKDLQSKLTTEEMVDTSIKEIFGRTLMTTIVTVIPVLILSILGVPLIKEFSFPILFGLLAGLGATLFLTPGLYVRFENARKARTKKKVAVK